MNNITNKQIQTYRAGIHLDIPTLTLLQATDMYHQEQIRGVGG